MSIAAGISVPDFEMRDDINTLRKLSDFREKPLGIYFYPEDDTPGYTKQSAPCRLGFELEIFPSR